MPELLEHVRLRVDPLKDAAGSLFGKADRVHLVDWTGGLDWWTDIFCAKNHFCALL